jgi:hypothetical protein
VTLSATQLLALAEHPITLVGPPGPGKANVIVAASASLQFGGTAFTNPGTAAVNVAYCGPSLEPAVSSSNLASLVTSGANEIEVLDAIAATYARVEMENLGILLSNPGADFTAGNGTLVLAIVYFVAQL